MNQRTTLVDTIERKQIEDLAYVLKQAEHELITTNGLYASDIDFDSDDFQQEFVFQIDFSKVISNVEKAIDLLYGNKPIEIEKENGLYPFERVE